MQHVIRFEPATREGEGRGGLDPGSWLRHCHGFRVDGPSGRLGIVEDVLYGDDAARPAALAVLAGVLGRRVEIVPVEDVAAVDPRRRRIALRQAA